MPAPSTSTVLLKAPQAPARKALNHDELDRCAEQLLATLLPIVAKMYREVALYMRVPLWVLVAGHLKNIYETGRLHTLYLEPGWVSQLPKLPTPTHTCEHCKRTFTPEAFGQRFCSNACGKAAMAVSR
jgi:hypothetical protein